MTSDELSKKKRIFLKEMKKEIKKLENDIKEYEDKQSRNLLLRSWYVFLLNLKRIYPYLVFSSLTFFLSNEIIEKNKNYLQKTIDNCGNIKYEECIADDESNIVLEYSQCTLKDDFYTRDILIYDAYQYTNKELIDLVKNNELDIKTLGNPIKKNSLQTKNKPVNTDPYIECIIYEMDKAETNYYRILIESLANLLGFCAIAYYREFYSDFSYEKSLNNINKKYPNSEDIEELKKVLKIRKNNYKIIRGKKNGKDDI